MHVVIAGGGSAGHIEPALNTADALRRVDPSIGITMLGTEKGLDTKLIPARGYDLRLIPAVPLPRKPSPQLLTVPSRLRGTVKAAREVLDDVQADVVVGFGGYVALPAYLAARKKRVPIVVHEANLKPGLANRVGARYARFIATGSPSIAMKGATCLGMPLRPAISGLDRAALRAEARAAFGLDPHRPTLFVTGGSQGARRLNQTMEAAAEAFRAAGIQVLHSYGDKNTLTIADDPSAPPYVARPYVDRMDLAYAAADFALARGGMMTCSEFAAVGLPAAYVPLPIGNGEQWLNARPVVDAGGGLLVDDAHLTPAWLAEHVIPLMTDDTRLAQMSEAAQHFGIRDADDRLARLIFEAAGVAWPGTDEETDGAASAASAGDQDTAAHFVPGFDTTWPALTDEPEDPESAEWLVPTDPADTPTLPTQTDDRPEPRTATVREAEWLVLTDTETAEGALKTEVKPDADLEPTAEVAIPAPRVSHALSIADAEADIEADATDVATEVADEAVAEPAKAPTRSRAKKTTEAGAEAAPAKAPARPRAKKTAGAAASSAAGTASAETVAAPAASAEASPAVAESAAVAKAPARSRAKKTTEAGTEAAAAPKAPARSRAAKTAEADPAKAPARPRAKKVAEAGTGAAPASSRAKKTAAAVETDTAAEPAKTPARSRAKKTTEAGADAAPAKAPARPRAKKVAESADSAEAKAPARPRAKKTAAPATDSSTPTTTQETPAP